MAQSQAHKAETHERILAEASERLRTRGLAAVSIADLMSAVGLTHGGFYRHFESREDLIAQAVSRALVDGRANSERATSGQSVKGVGSTSSVSGVVATSSHAGAVPLQPVPLQRYVKSYLSRSHRDGPGNGCAISALAGDVSHADSETRAVFTQGVKAALARISDQNAGAARASVPIAETPPLSEKAAGEAISLLSTLVGALVLSRAVDDKALSDLILAVNREKLLAGLKASSEA